jgi:hypothetical protein
MAAPLLPYTLSSNINPAFLALGHSPLGGKDYTEESVSWLTNRHEWPQNARSPRAHIGSKWGGIGNWVEIAAK